MGRRRNSIADFLSKTKRDEQTGCLLWQGAKAHGYGYFKYNRKNWRVHRLAWTLVNGQIPVGYDIHHLPTCDKSCCEPSHLESLPESIHMALSHTLGEINVKGENNGRAKITDEQVASIPELRKTLSMGKVAKLLGIGKSQVFRIEHEKQRKKQTEPLPRTVTRFLRSRA